MSLRIFSSYQNIKFHVTQITTIPSTLLSEEPFALFTNELEEKSPDYLIYKKDYTCQQAVKWKMNS